MLGEGESYRHPARQHLANISRWYSRRYEPPQVWRGQVSLNSTDILKLSSFKATEYLLILRSPSSLGTSM